MTDLLSGEQGITEPFIQAVCERLARDQRVRRRLPGGGRLHVDRKVPFLCVYRAREADAAREMARLVTGEAAYLVAPTEQALQGPVAALVGAIGDVMERAFGAFLVLELWTADASAARTDTRGDARSGARTVRRPTFRIVTSTLGEEDATVRQLHRALADIPLRPPPLDVELVRANASTSRALPSLIASSAGGTRHALGIEVQPVYRQASTGTAYPVLFQTLRRGLSLAIKQTAYHFAITHTTHEPEHYHALGSRVAVRAAARVDRALTEIARSFDFLLQVTPVNATGAWAEFERNGGEREPAFDYRPLVVDVGALKRSLYTMPVERLEDPTLAHLLSDARDELDRKVTMLGDRNTPRFLYGSLSVYGTVAPTLHAQAVALLTDLPPGGAKREGGGARVGAADFAARAEQEIAWYRARHPDFAAAVEIRTDVTGLMVSSGNLLVGQGLSVAEARVEALLQHEVGTHVVTYYNGLAQPLGQLATGLDGYEELQEGLAVLAEHFAGALGAQRVRLLAARVVAVRHLIDDATFVDTHRVLTRTHGFSARAAFTICMRVYRSGGLTKDAVYLRGLIELLAYLRRGGELESLFIGKVALSHVPTMQELRWRGYLRDPPLRPRHLSASGAPERLARLREGCSVLDLIQETAP